jgi:putative addiction module killer protein
MPLLQLLRYQAPDGREPLTEWLRSLEDRKVQARVRIRLNRIACGNFGDCEPVGEGVIELRLHFGPGYRIYFGRQGNALVVLLCGGSKRSQSVDISRAKAFLSDWKQRQA